VITLGAIAERDKTKKAKINAVKAGLAKQTGIG